MEYRREQRFKPNLTATVTVLGLMRGPTMQAQVLDVSGSGMRLLTRLPVPCGASVEIQMTGNLARGSVCRCEPDQDSYELGVQVAEIAPALKS